MNGDVRSVIHDFTERLEFSARLSDEGNWMDFYRRLWPEMLSCVRIDADSKWQRGGVDRMILLPDSKQILIDEKKREKDYGDILIEEWSVFYGDADPRNKIGWTLDRKKVCDYVAYAVLPSSRCYLLPSEILRLAAEHNLGKWRADRSKYPKDAKNNGYVTRNVAVSWPDLRRAICEQMLRRYGDSNGSPLPMPVEFRTQLNFNW